MCCRFHSSCAACCERSSEADCRSQHRAVGGLDIWKQKKQNCPPEIIETCLKSSSASELTFLWFLSQFIQLSILNHCFVQDYTSIEPCISHQDESHGGEEHEGEEDEEGEVDGAADVVGEGGGGLAKLLGDEGTTAGTVTTAVVVAEFGNTHDDQVDLKYHVFILRTFIKNNDSFKR